MKISHKLILSFLLVASLASVTTFFTLRSYNKIDNAFVQLVNDSTRTVESLHDLRQSGVQIVASTGEYGFIHVGDAVSARGGMAKDGEKRVTPSHRALAVSLEKYEQIVVNNASDDSEALETITASGNRLITHSDEIIRSMMRDADDKVILAERQKLDSEKMEFLKLIDAALEKEFQEQSHHKEAVQSAIALATRQTEIVTALTFILAILSGFYISFLISRRVGKLKGAIRKVGAGELDTQIEINSKDEIGDLAISFNKMIGDLKISRSNLAAAEIFNDKVLESMVDFVVVTDLDLNITKINQATLKLNGYEENELIGKSVNILMADKPFSQKGVDVLRKNGFAANLDKINRNKDGTLTPITMSLSVLKDEKGDDFGIVCVGKDITERRLNELQRQVVAEIVEGVITTSGLDELFTIAYLAINRVISAENCYIALHDPVTGLIRYEFWKDKVRPVPEPHPLIKNFGSYVLETRQPLLLTDDLKEQMYKSGAVARAKYSPSWMGVPLRLATSTVGILVVQDYDKHNVFSPRDLQFLGAIGDQLALAIERKGAENALRENEERFRELVENANDVIYTLDLAGKFTSLNRAGETLTGYSREEAVRKTLVEVIAPESVAGVHERFALNKQGIPQPNFELEIIARDGRKLIMDISSRMIVQDGVPVGHQGIGRDITERKRAETEREVISEIIQGVATTSNVDELLRLVHQSIKKVLYAENCFIALYDKTTELLNMEFFFDVADVAEQPKKLGKGLTAYVFHEGRPVLLTREEIRELMDKEIVELLGTPPAVWLGVPLRTPDGIIGVLAVQHYEDKDAYRSRDLDLLVGVGDQIGLAIERKRAVIVLGENEERFRELVENANDIIYTLDLAGNFTSLNRAGEEITGYSRAEAVQKSLADVIAPEAVSGVFERFARNKQGTAQPNFELEIAAKDGRKLTMDISSRLIVQGGVPVGIQGIGRNITERKRAEAEREIISEIIQGVATTANLDELLYVIHRTIGRILNADNCYVALYDSQTDMISLPFCIDKYDTVAPPAKLGTGLTAYLLKKGQPMLMSMEVICKLADTGDITSVGTRPAIWLGVPLKTPKGIIGAFVVQHYEDENAYDVRDLEFLTSVGDQIALAIERKTTDDENRRLNAEVATQGERLATIIGNVQGVVWETKTRREKGETFLRFDFVSDYIETMLGYSAEECLANQGFWLELVHPDDRKRTEEMVRAIFAGGKGGTLEFRWIARDGREVWIESRNTIIRDEAGKVVGLRGIAVDITDRKSFEEQLTHQALHDPLTKLANRVLFHDRVEHAINRTDRNRSPVSVLFLDLDNFKSVNDSLGHAAGDELLILVTERLQACLRTSDTPARLGGDEFAILVEDIEGDDEAVLIAERIRIVLCAPFSIGGTEVFISASIGVATRTNDHETTEELIRNADVAMYRSKSNGKDRYTVFENEMHDVLIRRIRLESDMRSAIDTREFEVYYQPIMNLVSDQIMGMEALVRWNHPEHGIIPPLDFIPLAEETGLIVPLGKWILEEACLQAGIWQAQYGLEKDLSITVNIASRQFLEEGLLEMVEEALAKSGLPAHCLVLEITESTMLVNTEATISKLKDLKRLGIRLAIDDFGTGYSSLSYLQRLPVDILKIDKSFVDKIVAGKEGAAVAKAIIAMGETLHLMTIAEGIESGAQQTELQNLGCELGQGFHFAKPLKAKAMNEFLRNSLKGGKTASVIPILKNGNGIIRHVAMG